jgi:site-specific DNA-methyltransferase (adenine-specific)
MSREILMHGDCLELMKIIPDNSIDCIICDPPYGTTACKWDSVIPFDRMWKELKRVTKDNSPICLFGSEPFSSHLRLSNLKMFKYDWIWHKSRASNFMSSKKMPLKEHEIISVFGGSNYYPIMVPMNERELIKQGSAKRDRDKIKTKQYGNFKELSNKRTEKYPRSIIKNIKSVSTRYKTEYTGHPTQKPVALLEYLVKTYTLEGETVLDFTMGSGSTGVACKNLNRKFIGIELDEKYFNIAKERLNNV